MEQVITPNFMPDDPNYIRKLSNYLGINGMKEDEYIRNICKLQREVIPFQLLLERLHTTPDDQILYSLIRRFEKNNFGILRHSIESESLNPDYFRLCQESSQIFFTEYVTEQNLKSHISHDFFLPFASELEKIGKVIPNEYLTRFTHDVGVGLFKDSEPNTNTNKRIYFIEAGSDKFFFTHHSLNDAIEALTSRCQLIMSQASIAEVVAKTTNQNISELNETTQKRDTIAWKNLIVTITENMSTIESNRQIVSQKDFIKFVLVLDSLLKSKVTQLQHDFKIQNLLNSFGSELQEKMMEIEDGLSETNFNSLQDSIGERLEIDKTTLVGIKKKFHESEVVSIEKLSNDNFGKIIQIENIFLHSASVSKIISTRYIGLTQKLNEYYKDLLVRFFMDKLPIRDNVFFGEESLEASVRQQVNDLDYSYYLILRNPVLLALAIVNQNSKKSADGKSETKIRQKLAAFFDTRNKVMFPWYTIFNIDSVKLAEKSFKNLNFFRKIWLLITGKYKSALSTFKRISQVNRQIASSQTEGKSGKIPGLRTIYNLSKDNSAT